jgi:hypothetical protein
MRIFVLGDSFAANLFAEGYEYVYKFSIHGLKDPSYHFSPIQKYLISMRDENIEDAKWWTDWLQEWGYEIINLGNAGCSNQNIFYQFSKINKEFKEGDRIILNWTDHCRFDWIADEFGRGISVHPNTDGFEEPLKSILNYQSVCVDESFKNHGGHLNANLVPFMDWIVEKHSEYNPIIWSVFIQTSKYINKSRFFNVNSPYFLSFLKDKWNILKETNFLFNDGHFGRYGNYYTAVLFDEIIKSGITTNISEEPNKSYIIKTVVERIKNENLIFKHPISWGNSV